jgi:hypothetical protein
LKRKEAETPPFSFYSPKKISIGTRLEAACDDRFNEIHAVLHVGGVIDVDLRAFASLI